jgi:prepilin-type processing-associated H-X9-DG protein
MYAQDYDERLPVGERWTTCVDPYIRNTSLHACPARLDLSWGYAMHRSLPETPMRVIAQPAMTPMLFDSELGVPSALSVPSDAAARHPGGANVAYVDGHVKVTTSLP